MVAHADLTGADLHEPKGVSTAAANTHYAASGAGSGTWQKLTASEIDTTSVFNTNIFFLTVRIPDIGTASSVYVPIPVNCTLTRVVTAVQAAPATTDTILTIANYALTTIGTITIAFSGSAAGDIDTLTATTNNTFLADTFLKITTDGGASNAVEAIVTLKFTWTS